MFSFKFIYFISCLVLLITTFIFPCSSHTCIHDQVAPAKAPLLITRSVKYKDIISERARDPKLFEKLQIHPYINRFDYQVSTTILSNVELAFNKIRSLMAKLFKVRKRKKPFVLQRQGCSQIWQTGPNRGRCSKYNDKSDLCSLKDINFEIPKRFLDKLEIYDKSNTKPQFSIPSGPGLLDSNFILFVVIEDTSFCQKADVSAYGSYCRLDLETNEPLAGIINLCSHYFSKKIYTEQHYYNVLLHELFHVLGFSYNLFEKYLPCEKGIFCNLPRNVIQEDSDSILRMMFPLVVKQMQTHFSCSRSDFGAPMMYVAPKENATNATMGYSSHWHPVLMYSSIMSNSFSEYEEVFVDKITLAAFESTGWYKVNYDFAENFKFGKDGGCDFGLGDSCENGLYLCDPKQNKTGCDLAHKAISRCKNLLPDFPCGVYQPLRWDTCESDTGKLFELDFYSLGYQEKCFMLNHSSTEVTPACLPVRCKSKEMYDILINMTWWPCKELETVEPIKNATVNCPEAFLFCSGSTQMTTPNLCPIESNFFIAIRMYFNQPEFDDLVATRKFKNFKITALKGIAEHLDIPVNFIVNSTLSVFKQIYLDFTICPAKSLAPDAFYAIVSKAQKFLDSKNFIHLLRGYSKEESVASSDIKINPIDAIAFSDHEGFRVLIIIPVICIIFIVTTLIASLLRQSLSRRHRPQRELVSQSDANMQMAEVRTY